MIEARLRRRSPKVVGATALRAAIEQPEYVVGRRIDSLGRYSVDVGQRNESVVGFDDAHRDVAITAAVGDAYRQRVGGLLLRNRDDVVEAPGRERVEKGRRGGPGLVCPGDADGVKPVFPDSSDDVVKGVEINPVTADRGALGGPALDQHPSDVCRRHRQTEHEVHLFCPRSGSLGSEITARPEDAKTVKTNRARFVVLPLGSLSCLRWIVAT